MTTPVQQKIRDKKRTPQQILDMVKSGEWIQPGSVGGDSTECMKELAKRLGPGPGQLKDIEIWNYAMLLSPPRIPAGRPQAGVPLLPRVLLLPLEPQGPRHQWRRRAGRIGDGPWACGSAITASSTP